MNQGIMGTHGTWQGAALGTSCSIHSRQKDTTFTPIPQAAIVPDSSISVAMEMAGWAPYGAKKRAGHIRKEVNCPELKGYDDKGSWAQPCSDPPQARSVQMAASVPQSEGTSKADLPGHLGKHGASGRSGTFKAAPGTPEGLPCHHNQGSTNQD